MRRPRYTPCLLFLAILGSTANGQDETRTAPDPRYGIAFASLAPLNTDIFVAASDGSDPKPSSRTQTSTITLRSRLTVDGLYSPRCEAARLTSTVSTPMARGWSG